MIITVHSLSFISLDSPLAPFLSALLPSLLLCWRTFAAFLPLCAASRPRTLSSLPHTSPAGWRAENTGEDILGIVSKWKLLLTVTLWLSDIVLYWVCVRVNSLSTWKAGCRGRYLWIPFLLACIAGTARNGGHGSAPSDPPYSPWSASLGVWQSRSGSRSQLRKKKRRHHNKWFTLLFTMTNPALWKKWCWIVLVSQSYTCAVVFHILSLCFSHFLLCLTVFFIALTISVLSICHPVTLPQPSSPSLPPKQDNLYRTNTLNHIWYQLKPNLSSFANKQELIRVRYSTFLLLERL